jgi:hypothetical protein
MKNFILGFLVAMSFSAVAFEKIDIGQSKLLTYQEMKEKISYLEYENAALWVSLSIGKIKCDYSK